MADRLTPAERAERRRRARVRYSLMHPRRLVVHEQVALDRAFLDANGVTIIDWTAIPLTGPDDPRDDEPRAGTPVPGRSSIRLTRPHSRSTKRTNYIAALVTGEYEAVARAEPGTRNNTLSRAAFRYGQAVGADLLDEGRAFAALEEAATKSGLPHREAITTIRAGLRAGARRPLEK